MQKSLTFLKGLAVVSCAGLLLFSFLGCFDDPVSDEDSVTITLVTFDSLTVNAIKQIEGTIEASPAVDESAFQFTISNNAASHFDITLNDIEPMETINLNTDLGLKITPKNTVPSGSYTLTIEVTAGTATSSKGITFGINNGTVNPDLDTIRVTLGSWNNSTYGSSLDADSMVVYKVAEAAANSAEIDVWYSNEARMRGADVFYSPKQAGVALHPPKDWATQNETQMATITVNFDNIVRQAQVDSLWALVPAGDKVQLLRLNANDIVILATNHGNARLIKFISGDGTDTGVAVIKGKKP